MRILHVLHHSEPYLDGYGVRSKSIVEFQKASGLTPVVLTSAQHEVEVGRSTPAPEAPELINAVPYYRTPLPSGPWRRAQLAAPYLRERSLMRALERSLARVIVQERIDLVHAHSPVLCGLPALRAARRHNLPFVYEVRAFWEDALLASKPSPTQALKYRYSRGLETHLFRQADAVVAISQGMLDDIASRQIPASRLFKMPNGVDTDHFSPLPFDRALAQTLGVAGHPLIGFIGSFFYFEGLECLVRAMPAILATVPMAKLMLVGTGEADQSIRELVSSLGLGASVLQTGRVPHSDILRYYSLMDVMVYPRRRERVTELVTPLKPLEAMAVGKAVIGSDVGGIRELLDEGRAGLLFKAGDPADLARAAVGLLSNADARLSLSAVGRQYVLDRRRWEVLVSGYLPIYSKVHSRCGLASQHA
jgi:PEP-CTERM/exosortase A-associated glycosyltransferase